MYGHRANRLVFCSAEQVDTVKAKGVVNLYISGESKTILFSEGKMCLMPQLAATVVNVTDSRLETWVAPCSSVAPSTQQKPF